MRAATTTPVMEGSLDDFSLVEILQVLGRGRDYTRVELLAPDSSLVGAVFLKSGKVVQATMGELRGSDAFFQLFQQRLGFFQVFREPTPALIPEPIGALRQLLMEASVLLLAHDEVTHRNLASRPAPSSGRRRPNPLPPPSRGAQRSDTSAAPRPSAIVPRSSVAASSGVHPAAHTPCIVAIASPKGGSGKTTVSMNLALSLTRRGYPVVLVDGDVNGDVLSSIDSRSTSDVGIFDVLVGKA